jgi:hypothetical protein
MVKHSVQAATPQEMRDCNHCKRKRRTRIAATHVLRGHEMAGSTSEQLGFSLHWMM